MSYLSFLFYQIEKSEKEKGSFQYLVTDHNNIKITKCEVKKEKIPTCSSFILSSTKILCFDLSFVILEIK